MKKTVLFATTNKGKLAEFRASCMSVGVENKIIGLDDLGYTLPECLETGETFQENSDLKVIHTRKHLKPEHVDLIVIAEDSGMTIDSLGGKPGVHTRRWNGNYMTDQEIIDYCLEMMREEKNRKASFVSSFSVSLNENANIIHIEVHSDGEILSTVRTDSLLEGLPFRALFYVPKLGMMFHEARDLSPHERPDYPIGQETAVIECARSIRDGA